MLGKSPSLYSLDTSRTDAPKVRTVREDIARLVHGRLVNRRWIESQLRHGWRGAAGLAQGVDALFVFAATTDAVTDAALDAVYGAYVGDEAVYARIRAANSGAARPSSKGLPKRAGGDFGKPAAIRSMRAWTSSRGSVMNAATEMRRGWCPDMLRPMETADGLLVRVHPRNSGAFRGAGARDRRECTTFRQWTSRSFVARQHSDPGPDDDAHPLLVDCLTLAGLLDGVRSQSPFRLTTLSPLAQIDPSERIDADWRFLRANRGNGPGDQRAASETVHCDRWGRSIRSRVSKGISHLWHWTQTALRCESKDLAAAHGLALFLLAATPHAIAHLLALVSEGGECAGLRLHEIGEGQFGDLVRKLALDPAEIPSPRAHVKRAGYVSNNGNAIVFSCSALWTLPQPSARRGGIVERRIRPR